MAKGKDTTPHIGIFGRRNNGKSSLINSLAGQDISIVSDSPGTTTDPVKRSFEITDFGPVVLIDTAGIDDTGSLGEKRIERTLNIISRIDLAMITVTDNIWGEYEKDLAERFRKEGIPFLVVHSKSDIVKPAQPFRDFILSETGNPLIEYSSSDKRNYEELISRIRKSIPEKSMVFKSLLGGIIKRDDLVLLVTPVDAEAPAGRMILPQMQAVRDVIDNHAVAIVLREMEIENFLKNTGIKPALVVTDSQAFAKVAASIPPDVPLTGFSIMLAHHKGNFDEYLKGTPAISTLQDGDRIILLESCSHHVACDDIGRDKIPAWLRKFTGKKLDFDIVAGLDEIPRPMGDYALLIQCGGCMITRRQLNARLNKAIDKAVPITNYGMTIAWVTGIYERAVAPFLQIEEGDQNLK